MTGKRLLIVEDDPLIGMDLEDEMSDRGYAAVCAHSLAKARALLDEARPDIVVLDMHVGSDTSFGFAAELEAQGVPFFFLSGNDASALPPHLATSPILTKPVRIEEVVRMIAELTGSASA